MTGIELATTRSYYAREVVKIRLALDKLHLESLPLRGEARSVGARVWPCLADGIATILFDWHMPAQASTVPGERRLCNTSLVVCDFSLNRIQYLNYLIWARSSLYRRVTTWKRSLLTGGWGRRCVAARSGLCYNCPAVNVYNKLIIVLIKNSPKTGIQSYSCFTLNWKWCYRYYLPKRINWQSVKRTKLYV